MEVTIVDKTGSNLRCYAKSIDGFAPQLRGGFALLGSFCSKSIYNSNDPKSYRYEIESTTKYFSFHIERDNRKIDILLEENIGGNYKFLVNAPNLKTVDYELETQGCRPIAFFGGDYLSTCGNIPQTILPSLPADYPIYAKNPSYELGLYCAIHGHVKIVDSSNYSALDSRGRNAYDKSVQVMNEKNTLTPVNKSGVPVATIEDDDIAMSKERIVSLRDDLPKLPKEIGWSYEVGGILFIKSNNHKKKNHPLLFLDVISEYMDKPEMKNPEIRKLLVDQAGRLRGIAFALETISSILPEEKNNEKTS